MVVGWLISPLTHPCNKIDNNNNAGNETIFLYLYSLQEWGWRHNPVSSPVKQVGDNNNRIYIDLYLQDICTNYKQTKIYTEKNTFSCFIKYNLGKFTLSTTIPGIQFTFLLLWLIMTSSISFLHVFVPHQCSYIFCDSANFLSIFLCLF